MSPPTLPLPSFRAPSDSQEIRTSSGTIGGGPISGSERGAILALKETSLSLASVVVSNLLGLANLALSLLGVEEIVTGSASLVGLSGALSSPFKLLGILSAASFSRLYASPFLMILRMMLVYMLIDHPIYHLFNFQEFRRGEEEEKRVFILSIFVFAFMVTEALSVLLCLER